jgi:hypothetical protein
MYRANLENDGPDHHAEILFWMVVGTCLLPMIVILTFWADRGESSLI